MLKVDVCTMKHGADRHGKAFVASPALPAKATRHLAMTCHFVGLAIWAGRAFAPPYLLEMGDAGFLRRPPAIDFNYRGHSSVFRKRNGRKGVVAAGIARAAKYHVVQRACFVECRRIGWPAATGPDLFPVVAAVQNLNVVGVW